MTVTRSTFSTLLEPGLAAVYFNEFDMYPLVYPKIFKVKTSEKASETVQHIVGVGLTPEKPIGVATTYEDIEIGWSKTFTHSTFSKGIRIVQELIEDDQYGVMEDMTATLARSARQRMEVDAADILNNAFSSSYTGYDAVSLINSSHVNKIGGTWSNAISPTGDLSVSTLQDAIEVIETMTDERGLTLALRPKLLVVPPALQWTAAELLESVHKPGTADNEINSLRGKSLDYIVNPYLTDSGAWFVIADNHKLVYYERVPLQFYKGNDFDTDDAKFKNRFRKSQGWADARGVTGST